MLYLENYNNYTEELIKLKKYFFRTTDDIIKELQNKYGQDYYSYYIIDKDEKNKPSWIYSSYENYLYYLFVNRNVPDIKGMENYPAWTFYDLLDEENPPKIKHDKWVIHFTKPDLAKSIKKEGFTRGVSNIEKLGWTERSVVKTEPGYNFGYLLSDYDYSYLPYGIAGDSKAYNYGEDCIMCKASGIRVWHNLDDEPQFIFWGPSAKNIFHIQREHNYYYIKINDKISYKNDDLKKVINFVVKYNKIYI